MKYKMGTRVAYYLNKKYLLGIIALLLANALYAGIDPTTKSDPKKDSTTTTNTDSIAAPALVAKAPDYAFKDLFVNKQFNPEENYVTQLNPQAVPFVQDYIRRHGKELNNIKVWGQPYFRLIDGILMAYGIPKEMKYLAVIESHLKPNLVSWVGAYGPWQFMPETGRQMGLTINAYYDERTDYNRSTLAAAKYMQQLYSQLGDWLLVVAAYNCGAGRVLSAIQRSGTRNFWALQNYLPLESRNHVKKFIGTHYLLEGSGGLTTSTADEWKKIQKNRMATTADLQNKLSKEAIAGTSVINIVGKYNSVIMAKNLHMDIAEFNQLNPGFDALVDSKTGYNLRLPPAPMTIFNTSRYIILHECIITTMTAPTGISEYPSASKLIKKKKQ
jgi:membrane-bound lytic murein transglycosylase D